MTDLLRSEAYVDPNRRFTIRFWQYLDELQNQVDGNVSEDDIASILAAINQINIDINQLKQTFSWKTIPSGETITIGEYQQMIVVDGITIDGDLILEGDLALI